MKETLLALAILGLLVMAVGLITIVKTLRGHRSIRLDWSGLGFNLKISAVKSADERDIL